MHTNTPCLSFFIFFLSHPSSPLIGAFDPLVGVFQIHWALVMQMKEISLFLPFMRVVQGGFVHAFVRCGDMNVCVCVCVCNCVCVFL